MKVERKMAAEHVVFHIPRCGGTALTELLLRCGSGPLCVDKRVDGRIEDKVEREGEKGKVVVSQQSKWLEGEGNVYIVMRDPVERAVSLYRHWEEGGVDAGAVGWKKKTFDEYVSGGQLESNWVTRALSGGKFEGECTEEMYEKARGVLLSSSVHRLSELEGLMDAMEERGVVFVDKEKAGRILRRKINASKGREALNPEYVDKLREVNDKDCRLWEMVVGRGNFSR